MRSRREIFHRYETQEDIIRATQIIHDSGVYWASYDFMLQHPFEKIEHLKETVAWMREFCAEKFAAFKKMYDLSIEISK